MVAAVAVQNINIVNFVKIVFLCISAEDTGNARIKSAAQQCGDASLFEPFPVSPLPLVFKFCGIFRFIVCRINIVRLGG